MTPSQPAPLACPHCGGPARPFEDDDCWRVECIKENCCWNLYRTEAEALAAWNRRAPAPPAAEAEAVAAACAEAVAHHLYGGDHSTTESKLKRMAESMLPILLRSLPRGSDTRAAAEAICAAWGRIGSHMDHGDTEGIKAIEDVLRGLPRASGETVDLAKVARLAIDWAEDGPESPFTGTETQEEYRQHMANDLLAALLAAQRAEKEGK